MIDVRPAIAQDAPALALILNAIIATGGTTAHEVPFSVGDILDHYITGPAVICCHVAILSGRCVGFQALDRNPVLPNGWGDIATFLTEEARGSGTAAALFTATCTAARGLGLPTINATIRADNVPGLAYYARIGFQDYSRDPDYCLKDGTRVGRVNRRFDL
jgi:RimJ/RimL family protein N-acetyltransferase